MKRMTTLKNHQRRITALETQVRDVDVCHAESIYRIKREAVANRLGIAVILARLGVPQISEEQIDEALDAE